MRVIACFMVILVHSVEPFYLGGEGTLIKSWSDGLWCALIDSPLRASVPLFVMASSYLLFPVRYDTGVFFRKRFVRVLVPLFVWTLLYSLIPLYGTAGSFDLAASLKRMIFNFPAAAGHLWFVYMLAGLYLLMPMLSPWIEKLSKRGEEAFLGLWLLTTVIPLARPLIAAFTGSSEVWGEASWNDYGTFYYVSGFVGYLVLGHYFREHVGRLSWGKTLALALPLWLAGYAIIAGGFLWRMPSEFPVSAPISLAVDMEISWTFCSFGVALTTIAYFLVIRKITCGGFIYRNFILPVSKISYGVYLMHIFVLVPVFAWVSTWGIGTPLTMLCTAVVTFSACAILTRLIAYIPKSKYIIG